MVNFQYVSDLDERIESLRRATLAVCTYPTISNGSSIARDVFAEALLLAAQINAVKNPMKVERQNSRDLPALPSILSDDKPLDDLPFDDHITDLKEYEDKTVTPSKTAGTSSDEEPLDEIIADLMDYQARTITPCNAAGTSSPATSTTTSVIKAELEEEEYQPCPRQRLERREEPRLDGLPAMVQPLHQSNIGVFEDPLEGYSTTAEISSAKAPRRSPMPSYPRATLRPSGVQRRWPSRRSVSGAHTCPRTSYSPLLTQRGSSADSTDRHKEWCLEKWLSGKFQTD